MRYYTDIIDVGKRKLPTGRQIMDSSRYFLKNLSGDYLLIEGRRIVVGKRSFAQVREVHSKLSVLLIRGQSLLCGKLSIPRPAPINSQNPSAKRLVAPSELSVLLIRGQFLLRSNQPQKEIASLSYKYEEPLFLFAAGGE